MIQIQESNMIFGDFENENVFQIELSQLHKEIGHGIKIVEFILLRNENELDFIEAKSSSPRPTKESGEKFDRFINEVSDKFLHSFNLYYSSILQCNEHYGEIHNNFFKIDNSKAKFKFILVIKGHELEWLKPLEEALYKKMQYHNIIWNSKVILMNEEIAQKFNLVKSVVE